MSEIGVRLEFSYFSEVPWAVLDAANKASEEKAWGSSRVLTELLCEDGTGVGMVLSPPPAQSTAHHAPTRLLGNSTVREGVLLFERDTVPFWWRFLSDPRNHRRLKSPRLIQ